MTETICSDCGYPNVNMTAATLAKGSSVRDPGEPVCQSCNSARVVMVRSLDKIPNSLDRIRDKRRVRGAA